MNPPSILIFEILLDFPQNIVLVLHIADVMQIEPDEQEVQVH